jgi:hypothetical protein
LRVQTIVIDFPLSASPFIATASHCMRSSPHAPGASNNTIFLSILFCATPSIIRDMTVSPVTSAMSESHSTPASSPPPADMESESVSQSMQQEEKRMRTQREKDDAKREAQLEKERQEDIKSGREVLDKKFQQLEFLMNKSKVSLPPELVHLAVHDC